MSRNSKKFQKQTNRKVTKSKNQDPKEAILSKLSFIASTETVKLPTEGLYYPRTSPLYGVSEVEVKHLTAKEEDMLSSLTANNSQNLFIRIAQSILVSPQVDASLFCQEDMTAILLNARKTGFGNSYTASEFCAGCAQVTLFEYDLSKQEVVKPELKGASYDSSTNTFEVVLPSFEDMKLKIRVLSDEEYEAIDQEEAKKKELALDFNRTEAFFKMAIVSVEGREEREIIDTLITALPALDSKIIKEVYSNSKPRISTIQEVECQSCGAVSRKEVPTSWAFFRPDKSIYSKGYL
tara:strand:+ start:3647 stop:4528 length:882 start_codon:yes stop_codon:yes gene_type:complete